MPQPVYALNLFDVANKAEYMAYSRRSPKEVKAHRGRVVALGKFRASATGDVAPRTMMIIVEWESYEAFESYCNDPALADLHAHRENGSRNYIWHVFDKLEDLRGVLK
jgi:uncharacterized protein (DUF1330 family)